MRRGIALLARSKGSMPAGSRKTPGKSTGATPGTLHGVVSLLLWLSTKLVHVYDLSDFDGYVGNGHLFPLKEQKNNPILYLSSLLISNCILLGGKVCRFRSVKFAGLERQDLPVCLVSKVLFPERCFDMYGVQVRPALATLLD